MGDDKVYTLVPSVYRGRFALDHPECGPDITSGGRVSVLLGGVWVRGTVEHSRVVVRPAFCSRGLYTSQEVEHPSSLVGGYYFVADDGSVCGLCTGMKVRLS